LPRKTLCLNVLSLEEELYLERLSNEELLEKIDKGSDIGILVNEKVEKFILLYTGPEKKCFLRYLARAEKYLPIVKKILKEEGLPEDLAYLPILESGYWPTARSKSKAVGYWQFIASTARLYGLRINHWIDERMDIEFSTKAAAKYLKDLYQRMGSWELAIAAYNAGPVTVERAINRLNSKNFWTLASSKYLRRETKEYVPRFMAILLLVHHPELYEIKKPQPEKFWIYEEVEMKGMVDLKKLCQFSHVSFKKVKKLNPALKTEFTPPFSRYTLRVPPGTKERFLNTLNNPKYAKLIRPLVKGSRFLVYTVKRGDSPYSIARKFGVPLSMLMAMNKIHNPKRIRPKDKLYIPISPIKKRSYAHRFTKEKGSFYKVEIGDTLWSIARKFNVEVSELKRTNHLHSNLLRPGDRLLIPRRTIKISKAKRGIVYKVKKGDTLWRIARSFSVKVRDLKKWNNLKSNLLHPGKELIIYASEKTKNGKGS